MIPWEKDEFLQEMVLRQLGIYTQKQKNDFGPVIHTIHEYGLRVDHKPKCKELTL